MQNDSLLDRYSDIRIILYYPICLYLLAIVPLNRYKSTLLWYHLILIIHAISITLLYNVIIKLLIQSHVLNILWSSTWSAFLLIILLILWRSYLIGTRICWLKLLLDVLDLSINIFSMLCIILWFFIFYLFFKHWHKLLMARNKCKYLHNLQCNIKHNLPLIINLSWIS